MPFIENTDYRPGALFRNPHFNTIYPHLLRKSIRVDYDRERFELSDGDFVDVDRILNDSKILVLVLHGLEGSSSSHYMKGLAKALKTQSFDVAALNQRGCSGEPNRLFKSYHSGKTDDLDEVVSKLSEEYEQMFIVGFSMGGNMCLKYAGEQADSLNSKIRGITSISVPCDLSESATYLIKSSNVLYMKRFMRMLKEKVKIKAKEFPDSNLRLSEIEACSNFSQFDNMYTAPANGFENAKHYWEVNSSKPFISNIKRNTLIINSLDDPFFGPLCQPIEEAKASKYVTLELLKHGGHVGFSSMNVRKVLWHEKRIIDFIKSNLNQEL